jgi:hypothetical protein
MFDDISLPAEKVERIKTASYSDAVVNEYPTFDEETFYDEYIDWGNFDITRLYYKRKLN